MTNSSLSPAAQAVLDAAYKRMDDNPCNEVEATLAAALRAAADQVVPSNALYARSCCEFVGEQCRSQLLAIIDELEHYHN